MKRSEHINQIKFLTETIEHLKKEINKYKYDELTGFLRRRDFNETFDNLWYEYQESGHRFILAMIDLNGLHTLNREFSFEMGDVFIKEVAKVLKENFEDSNVFRIGGDEFTILKRGNSKDDFDKRLKLLKNCSAFSVSSEQNFNSIAEMFNYVDDGVKNAKKKLKCTKDGLCAESCVKDCLKR
jgi:diguanylate cyclase (GGDEF)-like protein